MFLLLELTYISCANKKFIKNSNNYYFSVYISYFNISL